MRAPALLSSPAPSRKPPQKVALVFPLTAPWPLRLLPPPPAMWGPGGSSTDPSLEPVRTHAVIYTRPQPLPEAVAVYTGASCASVTLELDSVVHTGVPGPPWSCPAPKSVLTRPLATTSPLPGFRSVSARLSQGGTSERSSPAVVTWRCNWTQRGSAEPAALRFHTANGLSRTHKQN